MKKLLVPFVLSVLFILALLADTPTKFQWDANTQTNFNVSGYALRWGPASQVYTGLHITFGRFNTNTTVLLPEGDSYVVSQTLTADGLESEFSWEIVVTTAARTNPPPVTTNALPRPPANFRLSALVQGAWKPSGGTWTNLAVYEIPQNSRYPFYRLWLERP